MTGFPMISWTHEIKVARNLEVFDGKQDERYILLAELNRKQSNDEVTPAQQSRGGSRSRIHANLTGDGDSR